MKQQTNPQRRTLIISILTFVLLAAGFSFIAYRSYNNFEDQSRAEALSWLTTISNVKADGLTEWRSDILSYAKFINSNPNFSDSANLYLSDGDSQAKTDILRWFEIYQKNEEVNSLYLLNIKGASALSRPADAAAISAHVIEKIPEAQKYKQPIFIDFYQQAEDQRVYLAVLIPIFNKNMLAGFILAQIDPQIYLYPHLTRQVGDNVTTQSFLMRRAADEVVVLSPLKFNADAPLSLRFPISQKENLAAQAISAPQGMITGADYRGVEMIAVAQLIADSDWVLVTQIALSEVYAPVAENFGRTIVVTGTIIFYSGLGILLIWRQRQLKYEQSLRQAAELRALAQQMVEMQEAQIKNLARELHDGVGQNLTAININMSLLTQLLPADVADAIKARLVDTTEIVEETVARMRNVMAEFLPPMLENYGLAPTLAWYAEQFAQRTNIAALVHDKRISAYRLSAQTEIGLFRIAQEALNNVAKHAQARQIVIELKDEGADMLMTITDDGVGFNSALSFQQSAHWGFAIMRERAKALGADFLIQSTIGNGVTIQLRITQIVNPKS